MLIGEYQNSIDGKNRLIIPAKFRDELGHKCVLTKGLDGNLILYPMSTWAEQEKQLKVLPNTNKEARSYLRFVYSNAFECEMDKQGRILIPAVLKESAKLDKDLLTIGMLDRIEIWDKTSYENSPNGGLLKAEDFEGFSDKFSV